MIRIQVLTFALLIGLAPQASTLAMGSLRVQHSHDFAASRTPAAIIENDDRRVVPRESSSVLVPIGYLHNKTLGQASTAFLVDACHVLTAYHAVYGESETTPASPQMAFFVGQGKTNSFRQQIRIAAVVAKGDFHPRDKNRDEDWALLRLEECAGNNYGYLNLWASPIQTVQSKTNAVFSAGYAYDKDFNLGIVIHDGCSIRGARDNSRSGNGYGSSLGILSSSSSRFGPDQKGTRTWEHDCDTTRGSSGSPLLAQDQQGLWRVVALHVSSGAVQAERIPKFQPQLGNVAIPISHIRNRVMPHLSLPSAPSASLYSY